MYRIAIVEDDKSFIEELKKYLEQYSQEEGQEFEISTFYDGEEILENYVSGYDLILLDIKMPKVTGMDAAEKIREADETDHFSRRNRSAFLEALTKYMGGNSR